MEYRVDVRDLKFQLFDWLPLDDLLRAERFAGWDRDNVEMAVDEAVKIAREELAPSNQDGDRRGVVFEQGRVRVPASFKPAYRTLCEGGWISCASSPELGGLGLPETVGTAVSELIAGANLALSLVVLLTRGTAHLVESFGSDDLRDLVCRRMYSGEWTGTMCLTEPQAGSDLAACATTATPAADGRYRIRGEKIFITYGDHDLSENVIHAVLARMPDAPAGTRGLSLFIVPKLRVLPGGGLGAANHVECGGVEHKLGIHGSPTCSMLFGARGDCEGFLLGNAGEGMRQMFQMMNSARIEVGVEAAAVAGAAQQAALAYARERRQMRHWDRNRKSAPQVPILEHPDVRRMLLTSAAYVQAMRALLLRTSYYLDRSRVAGGEERQRYRTLVDLLTPICKAWPSDWGFRVTEWSMQVFGGYGYVRDYPAEQYLRDAKITSIYEGTNGIQALDFVGRKLPAHGDTAARELLTAAATTAEELAGDADLDGPAQLLGKAVAHLEEVLREVPRRDDGALLLALNAVPLLDMFGTTLGAHFLLEQARLARRKLAELGNREPAANAEAAFYHDKVQAAVCFAYRALPLVGAHAVALRAGEKAAMDAVF